jgi:hypothetical protein
MTTLDLQKADELVAAADMAVRVASQLRLWPIRKVIEDKECWHQGLAFLQQVLDGGKFIESKTSASGVSSLEPLTWTADLRFGSVVGDPVNVDYKQLLSFVEEIRDTLQAVQESTSVQPSELETATNFFSDLGKQLGNKADQALQTPSQRFFMSGDRYSY